jgi:pyruvate dehydrogenase E2 component (dihydrolipoamide acetyltransferase)
MATVIAMPKYGLTMKEGTVAKWLVEEGAHVDAGTPIAEIETQKTTSELEATASGTLLKKLVQEGEKAAVGAAIAIVGEPGEDASALLAEFAGSASQEAGEQPATEKAQVEVTEKVAAVAVSDKRIVASPVAKKLAAKLGVDLAAVAGTGPGGRITQEDVEKAATASAGPTVAPTATPVAESGDPRGSAKERQYSGMRRIIGERMCESLKTVAPVVYQGSVDAQELKQLLDRVVEQLQRRSMSIASDVMTTAAVVKAVALALESMPRFNSSLEGEAIKIWKNINIGVAVALSKGLIVPVVKDANRKSLVQIADEIRDLAERAQGGQLGPDDLTGGTFTVTTLGPYRSVDFFTPVINTPESAILGVGRMKDTVVAVDGLPAVRATMGLSLTCDHRVLDGAPSAEFLELVMDLLAEPFSLLA